MPQSFKEYYAKMRGQSTDTKKLYAFYISNSKHPLKDGSKVITRYAASDNQAVRFFKKAYPKFEKDYITAREYVAEIPRQSPEYIETNKPQPIEQLRLNI